MYPLTSDNGVQLTSTLEDDTMVADNLPGGDKATAKNEMIENNSIQSVL